MVNKPKEQVKPKVEKKNTQSTNLTYNKYSVGKTTNNQTFSEQDSLKKIQKKYQVRVESKERQRLQQNDKHRSGFTTFDRAPKTNQGPRRRNLGILGPGTDPTEEARKTASTN